MWKEESEKAGLKFNIQETKIMAPGPITSRKIDGEKVETVIASKLGSKITVDDDDSLLLCPPLPLIPQKAWSSTKAMTLMSSFLRPSVPSKEPGTQ